MSREPVRPFLISKDEDGNFFLVVRTIHYNSQHYPLVRSSRQDETFRTATEARNFAKQNFGAEAGQFELAKTQPA